jgi:hypothetical protein
MYFHIASFTGIKRSLECVPIMMDSLGIAAWPCRYSSLLYMSNIFVML